MKAIRFIPLLMFLFSFSSGNGLRGASSQAMLSDSVESKQERVYICVSKSAARYHYKEACSGLQRCTHTIRGTTISEAKRLGYTACRME